MVMSSKWMRLIGLVGFTAVLVSCKQTPQAPMNANYATMKITVSDKKFSTSYLVLGGMHAFCYRSGTNP